MTPTAIETAIAAMLQRIDQTARQDQPGFPHHGDPATGAWTRSPAGDWTGGFWVGELWLAAAATGDPWLRGQALAWSERLLPRAGSDTIFRGFLFWYGAAIGSVVLEDVDAERIARFGADGLIDLWVPGAGLFPLGTTAEEAHAVGRTDANIDGVPGVVPLLVWTADRAPGGPDVRRVEMARSHAQRHVGLCVRDDGSVCQSASFDPDTGDLVRRFTHKGVTDESTWTRAQAWAMLGYAHSLRWLGPEFAPVATTVADWWVAHLPDDGVAWWDFDAPGTLRDTSGTAIAAAALLKLAGLLPDRAAVYRAAAERMTEALVTRHLTPTSPDDRRPPGILADGCYNERIGLATSNELIWGDYFLFESLLHLAGMVDGSRI
jgi:unsaturated chondroitin disaccharide hydrolase